MPRYEFEVSLSTQEISSIYEGKTRFIIVKSDEGLKLQLPAVNFRRFVTANGIHGRFSVAIDAKNKIQALRKL